MGRDTGHPVHLQGFTPVKRARFGLTGASRSLGVPIQFISLLTVLSFLLLPEVNAQRPDASKAFRVSEFSLPQEWGHVAQMSEAPAAQPDSPQIIVIQDAHVNYEAQKHLADILDRLASEYGVKLILVEGGTGDVSLSFLRQRGPKAIRQEVAEDYLRQGLMAGEEYLDVVSEHPLILWGVDDPALYDAQTRLFLDLEQGREAAARALAQLRQVAERLQTTGFNEALRAFEAARTSFDAGTRSFGAYLDDVVQACERLGISLADRPHVSRMLQIRAFEADMDLERTQEEQRQALERVSARSPAEDLQRLQELAGRLKAEQVEPAAFYEELDTLMQRTGVEASAWPHLSRYMAYIRLKAQLQPRPLWAELSQLTRDVRSRLAQSAAETELVSLSDKIARCERLARLDWTPDDDRDYRSDPAQIEVSRWLPALERHAAGTQVEGWSGNRQALDEYLSSAVRFYDLAKLRDAEIVQRMLAKMRSEGEHLAVLITGGFHTDNLLAHLGQQSAEWVVITPTTGKDDPAQYAEVMRTKYRGYQSRGGYRQNHAKSPITMSQSPNNPQ